MCNNCKIGFVQYLDKQGNWITEPCPECHGDYNGKENFRLDEAGFVNVSQMEQYLKNKPEPDLRPRDPKTLLEELDKAVKEYANNLSENETEQAIDIEEKRSMLKWVQSGKLTPTHYAVAGIGAALVFAVTKLSGCL